VTTLSTDASMTLDELRALIFSSTDIPPEEQDGEPYDPNVGSAKAF
jgi:hypothetical protein